MKNSTPIHSDFKNFLRQKDNKIELFSLIADKFPKVTQNISTTVILHETNGGYFKFRK